MKLMPVSQQRNLISLILSPFILYCQIVLLLFYFVNNCAIIKQKKDIKVDLNTIDNSRAEKGVSLTIKDTDIEITVVSMNSNRAQKIFLANKEENTDVTPLLTIGWKNITRNGKEIKFSVEEAKKLYADYPLIGNQVAEFILNEQNFLKKN